MTYKELLEQLRTLPPEQLEKNVTVYDRSIQEMVSIFEFRKTFEEESVCSGIDHQFILVN